MRNILLLLAATALAGCTTITTLGNTFEGGQDFTIVPLPVAETAVDPNQPPDCRGAQHCISLARTPRFQVYPAEQAPGTYFTGNTDNIQISLKTGTIGWFSEGAEQRFLNNLFNTFSPSPLKGEVALVAHVTEGIRQPGGRKDDGTLEGRVVFYSDDIYKGQRFNEFNVPIYGPAAYAGGPLTIDLWLLELDRAESEQMGAVLSTLASLSRKMPSLPTGGIDLLSQIGTSFLKSNDDDIIGHFTVTLMPPEAGVKAADPILSVSDIIIRRTINRSPDMTLANCYYQPETGRLFGPSCSNPLDNFLVLALRKSDSSTSIAPDIDLAGYQQRLLKTPGNVAFQQETARLVEKVVSETAYQRAFASIDRLKDASTSQAVREIEATSVLTQLQCALLASEDADAALVDEVCGEGSKAKQMPMGDFDRVVRKLVDVSCLAAAQVSKTALLGDGTSDGITSARAGLVDEVLARRGQCPTPQDG